MTFEYRLEADATTPDLRHGCLSKARVASPLDLCHFASHDIDFERSVSPDIACPSLERNFVMSGQQRRPKAPLGISGKGCDLALLAFHHESRVREWPRTRSISPHGAGLNGADRNDAFDPRLRTGSRLSC